MKPYNKKIIPLILSIAIVFTTNYFLFIPKAQAVWGISDVSVDPAQIVNALKQYGQQLADAAIEAADKAKSVASNLALAAAKIAALLAVQKAVALMIGDTSGDSLIIRDYNNYLFVAPKQRAMAQMDAFFNTVSKGRLSYLNYEGVGPNYDAYLVSQAKQVINGTNFVTNIQEQVSDPSQLFSGGNMKAFSKYMECANNVACYTFTAANKYNQELTKAQEIAKLEQQNGLLPKKSSTGRIISPAILAQNALLQVDQMGTNLIISSNAETWEALPGALMQVAEGAVMSIASRAINYGISDKAGQAAIQSKNAQFPFSLSYSSVTSKVNSAIQSGVNSVNSSIQSGINTINNTATNAVNSAVNTLNQ
jgi:lambda repressor-like predicted transcriptional regulator